MGLGSYREHLAPMGYDCFYWSIHYLVFYLEVNYLEDKKGGCDEMVFLVKLVCLGFGNYRVSVAIWIVV